MSRKIRRVEAIRGVLGILVVTVPVRSGCPARGTVRGMAGRVVLARVGAVLPVAAPRGVAELARRAGGCGSDRTGKEGGPGPGNGPGYGRSGGPGPGGGGFAGGGPAGGGGSGSSGGGAPPASSDSQVPAASWSGQHNDGTSSAGITT